MVKFFNKALSLLEVGGASGLLSLFITAWDGGKTFALLNFFYFSWVKYCVVLLSCGGCVVKLLTCQFTVYNEWPL